jgi:uncharacterized membrane protein
VSEEERNIIPPEENLAGTQAAGETPAELEVASVLEESAAEPAAADPAGEEPATATASVEMAPAGPEAAPSDDDRLMSALCWIVAVIFQLPILSVVLLLIEPNKSRPFQRYHAVTSIIFWIGAAIYELVAGLVYLVLSLISLGCLAICGWVIFLVPHALMLYYAYQAYKGVYRDIPFATELARKQGWIA